MTRLFFWSSLAKLCQDIVQGLGVTATFGMPLAAAERRSFPPGDPGRELLKIVAAPLGQPGSLIGAFPSPPVINAKASGEMSDAIAVASKPKAALCHCLRRRPSIDGDIGMISNVFLVSSNLFERRAMTWFLRLSEIKDGVVG